MKKRVAAFMLSFILLLTNITISASAAVGSFYYLNGEKHYITNRNFYYNDNRVSLSSSPALVIDGYNYVPLESGLLDAVTELSGSYNSSSKKITLSSTLNNATLVMTLNSTSASLNGSAITLTSAPYSISFSSGGSQFIYVPVKDAASRLGFTYSYTNSGKKISLSSTANEITSDSSDMEFKTTITLKRPSDVSKGSITCTDDYHNKRFLITMSGNYKSYYTNNAPSLPSGVTFSVSYSSSSDKTTLSFTTSSINGWRIREDNSKIYIMNGVPSKMFKNIIVLDPGHGGSDPGAVYGDLYEEADFTLAIVLAAAKLFKNNSDYKVYCTRLGDDLPAGITKVWDRRTFANDLNADIFISVHINSYETSAARGTETLYNSANNVSNSGGLSCQTLANIVHKYILNATGFKDRGVKVDTSLSVLNKNNNPAVLTEVGFISNLTEAKTMAANLDKYGEALYNAIIEASTKYPTSR